MPPGFAAGEDGRGHGAGASCAGQSAGARTLRNVLLQVARGLVAVHGAGKLHRNIKPPNIMVTTENRAVVNDFGLAQEVGSAGVGRAGTLAYMSPDQSVNETLTPATDWYAFGTRCCRGSVKAGCAASSRRGPDASHYSF